jgi:hypothetical protein
MKPRSGGANQRYKGLTSEEVNQETKGFKWQLTKLARGLREPGVWQHRSIRRGKSISIKRNQNCKYSDCRTATQTDSTLSSDGVSFKSKFLSAPRLEISPPQEGVKRMKPGLQNSGNEMCMSVTYTAESEMANCSTF